MQDLIKSQIQEIASKSEAKDIFIIGKGPSVDLIDISSLPSGIIINLNDSERVIAGDIGIFSANWVRHSLAEDGFRCGFYLAGKPLPSMVPHEVLPPIPLELDQDDFMIARIEQETFFDESFVLLNALKLALAISRLRGAAQNVYLLGFDFTTRGGSMSQKIGNDYSGVSANERDAIIEAQESEFRQIDRYFEDRNKLVLFHVGNKEFSAYSPAEFNRKVTGKEVGLRKYEYPVNLANPDRVLIVAEFTNNHLGDAERLVEMIERSKESGADLIKVQKRHVDTFYSKEQLQSYYWSPFGKTLGDYRKGVELNDELLELLNETCAKFEIDWFCSVLDYASFEAIKRFDPKLIKIPSTISNHREYHARLAADYHGPVVVSTGLTEEEYIDHVLSTYQNNSVLYLLHCISAYPTVKSDCNIAIVNRYQKLALENPRILPGYSSHDLGSAGCMLAVAAGARMIEKHVKLGNVDWIHFDKVAIDLTTNEFAKLVDDVRMAEEMIGTDEKRILSCEHHKYSVIK